MDHELKCWPEYYDAIENGSKPFELRKNDRNYRVGDILFLRRWDPDTSEYTGQEMKHKVTYLLDMEDVPFLPKKVYDWVILGLENTENATLRESLKGAQIIAEQARGHIAENERLQAELKNLQSAQVTHYCENCEKLTADLARYRTAENEGRLIILKEKIMPQDCKMHYEADYLGIGRCHIENGICEGYCQDGDEPHDNCKECKFESENAREAAQAALEAQEE